MKFQLGNIKKVVSIAIQFQGDELRIDGVLLRYKKGEIEVLEELNGQASLKGVLDKWGNKHPYIVHFTGKGILNKKAVQTENLHQSILLNANPVDFYFTDFQQDDQVFSSVIRRSVADEVVADLTKEKVQVISLSSGPFLVMAIAPFLGLSEFNTQDYQLTLSNQALVSFGKKTEATRMSYQIGEQRVSERSITAVAHGVLFFTGPGHFTLPDQELVFVTNLEEAKQKVIFSQFGFFMMGFFLVILFGNYLYLNHLNKTLQHNSFLLAEYQEEFDEIKKLEEEKTRKEILLRTSGVLSKKYVSFYLAEISSTVPKSISFTRFTVKPLKQEIKRKHKIEIDNQLIYVSGISKTSSHLSDWILKLQAIEWIRKVIIKDYDYLDGQGEFNLEIVI